MSFEEKQAMRMTRDTNQWQCMMEQFISIQDDKATVIILGTVDKMYPTVR
jgi:hypothetical protein